MTSIGLVILTISLISGILAIFVKRKLDRDVKEYIKRTSYMSEINRWSHRHPTINRANKFSFTNTYMKKP
jgi:hypothetical protein